MNQEQKPYVSNAADKGQVKEASKKQKLGRDQELEDVRHVLSTKAGRRFYWRLLAFSGLYQSSADGRGNIWLLEGQRNVGLLLNVDMMEANPNAYLLMIKENQEEVTNG